MRKFTTGETVEIIARQYTIGVARQNVPLGKVSHRFLVKDHAVDGSLLLAPITTWTDGDCGPNFWEYSIGGGRLLVAKKSALAFPEDVRIQPAMLGQVVVPTPASAGS